ncbi:potassium-transporting ATPase subunit C [Streptomyces qinglanensis]|uniref:Potassium-transporting ATPase KdpC subunit n=1 Tax=Streptomyces qinglanensis TaxID=943816 RepID=A0A1E7K7U8_9ACTN|nr:potassium-transporting ATPase subunit KdpC [Streptomyces qinglanensis]OEU99963.1 potassium-transporting ATPase subunit C [Streptomyces qinglanensis]OEV28228.1 potassium-transporting ATPase subunit C [Streptomyces nanshensis]
MTTAVVRAAGRLGWAAGRALLALTLLCGVLYPLAVTGVAQAVFPGKANGSPVRVAGEEVGSALIGQQWRGRKWFHGRPSHSGYDPRASGSGQLGASDPRLVASVRRTRHEVAELNGVPPAAVPPDAVTGSASALDPHISPRYARIQSARVARANGLPVQAVRALVASHTEGRGAGFLGEEHVNVLKLNVALRAAAASR